MSEAHARQLRLRTVVVLYLTYLCFYLARKADAISKSGLSRDAHFTLEDLARGDTAYLFTYTFALFASGMLGGKVPSGILLTIGLLGIAAVSFLKSQVTSPWQFAALQVAHALFQSTGWPTCIKVLATWITHNRGTIMGLWTTCQSLGGVAGALAATYFSTRYGWESAYQYHVPVLVVMAAVVLATIKDEPPAELAEHFQVNVVPDTDQGKKSEDKEARSEDTVSVWDVIALPGVLAVGASYFFLKFMRYALLFWLPYYFESSLHYDPSLSGYLSTSFELGGAVGTPLIGFVSDRYMAGRRDLTAGIFMSGAAVSLSSSIALSTWGPTVNAICMFFTGILVIGPDSVLSGTIAQDIGQRSGLGKAAVGSVAGLLNSIGSAGSIFQSGATAYISKAYGWPALFGVFVLCAVVSALILFQVASRTSPAVGQFFASAARPALAVVAVLMLTVVVASDHVSLRGSLE